MNYYFNCICTSQPSSILILKAKCLVDMFVHCLQTGGRVLSEGSFLRRNT